jgi:hypothetical protein
MTTYDVSSLSQLNAAIEAVDAAAANSGAQTIDIESGTISLTSALEAINLNAGVSLTIAGDSGAVLDGGGTQRGLFIYSGDVTVENLTLQNMKAVGGAGGSGGGGAGLGGGLFVAGSSDVTLDNVAFNNDAAKGGAGGSGSDAIGGGGLGGKGASDKGGGGRYWDGRFGGSQW